ncbi:MAG: TauD/TfdA family dioxygenase [Pseudomonadota bacterium]
MNSDFHHIDVRPLTGALGAEIFGVDLSKDLDEGCFDEIKRAFADHSVIFFRDQVITPEQHIAFAQRWGAINVNRFFEAHADYPMIAVVRKEADQAKNIGGMWHADHSYDQEPALGSALYACEVPDVGGDTLFASMYHAYESLSDGMKSLLSGLNAVHSSRHVFGPETVEEGEEPRFRNADLAVQDSVHPVIIRHPDTGRQALYVNPDFTVRFEDWTKEESQPLLDYLYQHAARPEFTARFRWQKGSLALWDNRATWHYAINDYPGARRVMHRITIDGGPLGA